MEQRPERHPQSLTILGGTGIGADTGRHRKAHRRLGGGAPDGRSRPAFGFAQRSWRRFRRDPSAVAGLSILVLIVLFALAAGLISRYLTGFTPDENHLAAKLTPPFTDGYLLGADGNGRDILTRLAYGGRVTLLVATLAAACTLLIGVPIGLVAGYAGGLTDATLMRLVDVVFSIPTLPLLILTTTLYPPSVVGLALILALVGWGGVARLVRAEALSLRRRPFVEAARVAGASPARIVGRHVFPNVAPLVVVNASLALPELILTEVALSFLGLGVRPPNPSWGTMLGEAQGFYRLAPTNVLVPGGMIFLTALALYLVGTGLRDALDPRLAD